ncbi:hypothetical protein FBQ97_19565, partial [Acidobacteria bacterium ACD]|nr:hypothetical protein [Acidobacteria bacterium ACD]
MRRCRLPSSFTSLAAAGALATALVAARSLGAEQVPPSWVTQVPLSEPGGPAAILAAGSLADGSVLMVLGNWEGYRFARVSASGELLGTA